jgi:hypothetical protein
MPASSDFVSKLRNALGNATIGKAVAWDNAGKPSVFVAKAARTVAKKTVDGYQSLSGRQQRAQPALLQGLRRLMRRNQRALQQRT